ncbi:MAG: hypothetical protein HC834_08510 [Rhodospirillales bacterium]|nr:hypothetical protein [Rhodospirillales bacterium]
MTLVMTSGPASEPVTLAEAKGLEARLSDLLDQLVTLGLQVKGWAPLLVDLLTSSDRGIATASRVGYAC